MNDTQPSGQEHQPPTPRKRRKERAEQKPHQINIAVTDDMREWLYFIAKGADVQVAMVAREAMYFGLPRVIPFFARVRKLTDEERKLAHEKSEVAEKFFQHETPDCERMIKSALACFDNVKEVDYYCGKRYSDEDEFIASWTLPPLHLAVEHGRDLESVNALLAAGADPNARDSGGRPPLHLAVEHGRGLESVNALLAAGADPNARDSDGRTPLQVASVRNVVGVVEALLAAGADPNGVDAAARKLADALQDLEITVLRRAGETGRLFGSVGPADIAQALVDLGYEVTRQQVRMPEGERIRQLGEYAVTIHINAAPEATIRLRVDAESSGGDDDQAAD